MSFPIFFCSVRVSAAINVVVTAANGIKVLLFEDMRPTPELSYAIRWGKCNAGVMVTASHNPKEYNGYKMYWEDGAQIIAPHDSNIIAKVVEIEDPSQVKWGDYGKAVESGDIRLVGAGWARKRWNWGILGFLGRKLVVF